ncbi:MAG: exo-alpha-sialidase [Phycisphaerae bacterium]|nr:exo-alpha-sialidase [Phycisphaerae bacterium]
MKRHLILLVTLLTMVGCQASAEQIIQSTFEEFKIGQFTEITADYGSWKVTNGKAEVTSKFTATGENCLHLFGGTDTTVEFTPKIEQGPKMIFKAERWTSSGPFKFRIEGYSSGKWTELYNGDKQIKVGARFLSNVELTLPTAKPTKYRFICSAPESAGILIDAFAIKQPVKMELKSVSNAKITVPALIGYDNNPILQIKVEVKGDIEPVTVSELSINSQGTTNTKDIESVSIFYSGNNQNFSTANQFSSTKTPAHKLIFQGNQKLTDGTNYFWVSYKVKDKAKLTNRVGAGCTELKLSNGKSIKTQGLKFASQRIGFALRKAGQDGSYGYRIPGLATTNKGTLIAVYDIRWNNNGDLPGNIDIGMNRSTDGGQSWEPMKIIMDMGNDKNFRYDGIGDPTVLVDRNTGTIWCAAIWSHGNRGWHGSGPGLEPVETGQFILVKSDDDGKTWSKPINITKQVKKPQWCLLLQGPGKGFTMRDGTLILPAQYQDTLENHRIPHSTFIYSKDHGKTWEIATGAKPDTTEAQLVELDNGSLMINMRDNRNRGDKSKNNGRAIFTTNDMGKTWIKHPTSRNDKYLVEPTCQASIIRFCSKKDGFKQSVLLFSNPNSKYGRTHITIKASLDEGESWPTEYQLLLREPGCAGYSCMTVVDEEHVGIFYEGNREIHFEKIHISEILGKDIKLK